MKKFLVSIIMPVYNVLKIKNVFLKAVNSILNQSYNCLQIILVNDGSTDETIYLLKEIQHKDDRILIIDKPNGGVESARREGLKHCTGDYIMHMDQDDYMHYDAIRIMLEFAINENADIVLANSARFINNPKLCKKNNMISETKIISKEEFRDKYYRGFFGINIFEINIWNKLYKKSFLDSLPSPPLTGFYNEDLSYNMHIMPKANLIGFMNETLYFYRWGGFTSKKINRLLEVALNCYDIKMKQIIENNVPEFTVSTSIELLNYINTYFIQLLEHDKLSKSEFLHEVSRCLDLPQVRDAIYQVSENSNYRNSHVEMIITNEIEKLYKLEIKRVKRNRMKNLFKKIFSLFNK